MFNGLSCNVVDVGVSKAKEGRRREGKGKQWEKHCKLKSPE